MIASRKRQIDTERLKLETQVHFRNRWWHEDHLVNQRTTWLLTTQGVLSGAFGFLRYRIAQLQFGVLDEKAMPMPDALVASTTKNYAHLLEVLSRWIVVIGVTTSLISLLGIHAAVLAQEALAKEYSQTLGVTPKTTRLGHFVARSTPFLCAMAWVVALTLFHALRR